MSSKTTGTDNGGHTGLEMEMKKKMFMRCVVCSVYSPKNTLRAKTIPA